LPEATILIVSVIRSPQKREKGVLGALDAANKALIKMVKSMPGVLFADVNPALETAAGEPVMECYVSDKLHLTLEGYRRMTSVLKPVLEAGWKPSRVSPAEPKVEKMSDKE
jgi:lysophospholipase L1-like esterase